jgi:cytochrome c biogenesis protein
MAAIEENLGAPAFNDRGRNFVVTLAAQVLKLFSSVRLGVVLLCLLAIACLIGMLIMQQSVDGFENYYATLTPAQRLVYGKLGFFDIYHSGYFNVLLLVLSLNIILASIDRFPKAWRYFRKPQLTVPLRWLAEQKQATVFDLQRTRDESVNSAVQILKRFGWRSVRSSEKDGRVYLFAQSGLWNRLGAYAVHVALLTIFLGGFLTAQFGTTGNLPLSPGQTSNLIFERVVDLDRVSEVTMRLPFDVTFTDIEQKLIKKDGALSVGNTIDWITRFSLKDETGAHDAMVQMNRPFDYRGYRFFQASFAPVGRARNITLQANAADGGQSHMLTIPRDGTASLPDGTKIRFSEFRGNFRVGPEERGEDTSEYPNPAAVLQVIPPGGTLQNAYAFGPQMANIPIAGKPVGGYTFKLLDFEKVSEQHVLSVQRDPGANVVYVGFALLFLTLVGVFFFSHQRVWVVVEELEAGTTRIISGGDTNRNQNAFDDKLEKFANELRTQNNAQEAS